MKRISTSAAPPGLALAATLLLTIACAEGPPPASPPLPTPTEPATTVADPTPLIELRLRFEGWGERRGRLVAAVYADAASFESGGKARRSLRREVDDGRAEWQLRLPPGTYAVKAFLDLDGDAALGRGAFGVPSEPYGFSNDARGAFGPPTWSAASFDLTTATTQVIALR